MTYRTNAPCSAGIINTLPTITQTMDNVTPTLDGHITGCRVRLYDNPNFTGALKTFDIPAIDFSVTDNTTNYLIVKYNGGSPIYDVTTDVADINESDVIPINTILVTSVWMHFSNWDKAGDGITNKLHRRFVKTQRYARETGLGLEVNAGVVHVGGGIVWRGTTVFNLEDVYSDGTNDSIWYFYYHDGGNWTHSTSTDFNNTQYDNGTALAGLSTHYYNINWVFRGVEDHNHCYYVLSDKEYKDLPTAIAESKVPSIHTDISSHAILVGRIFFKNGVATPAHIEGAFETTFIGTVINEHNDLSGLDGGTPGEYYHLTLAEHSALGTIPSFTDIGDAPSAYVSTDVDKVVKVNATFNGIEFSKPTFAPDGVSVDSRYGPWNSVDEALLMTPSEKRFEGLTFSVFEDDINVIQTSASTYLYNSGTGSHGYVLDDNGYVWAFGVNNFGQLGDGTNINRNYAVKVHNSNGTGFLSGITKVIALNNCGYALKEDGTVWAWGYGGGGELGNGTFNNSNRPVQVSGLSNIIDIFKTSNPSNQTLMALKSDKTLWAWGNNRFPGGGIYGLCGTGNAIGNINVPEQVIGPNGVGYFTNVKAATAGFSFCLVLLEDGTLWSWGLNSLGERGFGAIGDTVLSAQQVVGVNGVGYLTDVVSIASCVTSSIALKSNNTLYSWGSNYLGESGTGIASTTPNQVKGINGIGFLNNISQITSGSNYTYTGSFAAITNDGSVCAWGIGNYGAIGDGTFEHRYYPTLCYDNIGIMNNITDISLSLVSGLAIKNNKLLTNGINIDTSFLFNRNIPNQTINLTGKYTNGYILPKQREYWFKKGIINAELKNDYVSSIYNYNNEYTLTVGDDNTTDTHINGKFHAKYPVITKSVSDSPYTALDNDYIIIASGNTTITLPPVSTNNGRKIVIKKTDDNTITTIDGNLSETIDGSLTKTLTYQYESVTIVCDGSAWWVI